MCCDEFVSLLGIWLCGGELCDGGRGGRRGRRRGV